MAQNKIYVLQTFFSTKEELLTLTEKRERFSTMSCEKLVQNLLITMNSQMILNNVDKNKFYSQSFTHSFC